LVRAAERLACPRPPSRVAWATSKNCWPEAADTHTRRQTLTEFGQEFLDTAGAWRKKSPRAGLRAQSDMQPRGRLRVSMPGDYARLHFSRAIATFIESHPR